jgi:hypothetical protein
MEPMSTIPPLLQHWAPGQPLLEDADEEEDTDDISTTTSTATSLACFDQDLKNNLQKSPSTKHRTKNARNLSCQNMMQLPNSNNNFRKKPTYWQVANVTTIGWHGLDPDKALCLSCWVRAFPRCHWHDCKDISVEEILFCCSQCRPFVSYPAVISQLFAIRSKARPRFGKRQMLNSTNKGLVPS